MSNNVKQHSALFLILLVVFPAISNSMHFVFTLHERNFTVETNDVTITSSVATHNCEQDLFHLTKFIDFSFFEKSITSKRISQKINKSIWAEVNYQANKPKLIRGPPYYIT